MLQLSGSVMLPLALGNGFCHYLQDALTLIPDVRTY